jgi:hypothetical protein
MYNDNNITLTMSKKQLDYIIFTMGVALDTDCKPMNKLSSKKFEKITILREVLQVMLNQAK